MVLNDSKDTEDGLFEDPISALESGPRKPLSKERWEQIKERANRDNAPIDHEGIAASAEQRTKATYSFTTEGIREYLSQREWREFPSGHAALSWACDEIERLRAVVEEGAKRAKEVFEHDQEQRQEIERLRKENADLRDDLNIHPRFREDV
jgi:L-2-hydroxyglutarate oxidase LhgO